MGASGDLCQSTSNPLWLQLILGLVCACIDHDKAHMVQNWFDLGSSPKRTCTKSYPAGISNPFTVFWAWGSCHHGLLQEQPTVCAVCCQYSNELEYTCQFSLLPIQKITWLLHGLCSCGQQLTITQWTYLLGYPTSWLQYGPMATEPL